MSANLILTAGQSNVDGFIAIASLQAAYQTENNNIKFYDTSAGSFNSMNWASNKSYQAPLLTATFAIQFSLLTKIQNRIGSTLHCLQYAISGTSLAADANPNGDWFPSTRGELTDKFGSAYNEAYASLFLSGNKNDINVPFCYWGQGGEDSKTLAAANAYEANLTNWIAQIRRVTAKPNLPFIICLLNSNIDVGTFVYKATVRTAQTNVSNSVSGVYLVDPDSCALSGSGPHYTAQGYEDLGQLIYNCAVNNSLI